jgi:hypothetical protein
MKYKLLTLAIFAGLTFSSCGGGAADRIDESRTDKSVGLSDVDGENLPEFTFEDDYHNFGQITEGEIATHEFSFTNTGKAPLVITSARGSCGCTVPEYPKTPIAPGESGKIKVSFDSNGRFGRQDKNVTLTANTIPNQKILKITSEVLKAEE